MPKPRRPQHRKDEPLHAYVDRVCDYIIATQPNREELKELLHGVSSEAYIRGSNAAWEIFKKHQTS
jgi:hypothetical protein